MNQLAMNHGMRKLAIGATVVLLLLMLVPTFAHANDGEQYTVHVDTGYLALRSAPTYDDNNVIAKLYTGDVVTFERDNGNGYWWVYAPAFDKSGYVNQDYLITAACYGDYNVHVDTGYLALRTAPAYDDGNIIGELYNGDVVTVKDMSNGQYWWVYSPKYDACGYVNKDNLTVEPATYGDYQVKVAKGYLALRSEATYDDNNIIGKLNTGDVVQVEEKRGGGYWWVYSPKLNREGYVNADYLVGL